MRGKGKEDPGICATYWTEWKKKDATKAVGVSVDLVKEWLSAATA